LCCKSLTAGSGNPTIHKKDSWPQAERDSDFFGPAASKSQRLG
jgi:hypothetical protein